MLSDRQVMVLIRTKSESCVFTALELTEWLLEVEESPSKTSAYRRALRLSKRLPVEALSKKIYRLAVIPNEVMEKSTKKTVKKEKTDFSSLAKEVLDYLNAKAGTKYKGKPADLLKIKARMSPPENFGIEDFKKVIDNKVSEWKGTDMEKYLRPETLFSPKFESYLQQKEPIGKGKAEQMSRYSFEKYLPGGS